MPIAVTKQAQINNAVGEVQKLLSPDVTRIRYEIGQDWSGEWAIFFRIVLSDEAARNKLRDVANKIDWELERRLDFVGMGVFAYLNFRSDSEQAALQEPAWA